MSGGWYSWGSLQAQLNRIETKLNTVIKQESAMAIDVTALTAEVARNTTVEQSVVTLVNNLAAQIAAIPASSDPVTQAALDSLKTTLSQNDDAIAAAVAANTVAPAPAAMKR